MELQRDNYLSARHYTTWQVIKAYWLSSNRYPAYLFFAVIMLMTVTLVGLDVVFNYWYNHFYDALQAYNREGAVRLLMIFFVIAAFHIVIAVYRYFITQLFGLRWRRWLTEQFIGRWLQNRTYYLLENFDAKTDNPDQRIQEDVGSLVNYSLDLSIGLMSSITTFLAFIYILWQLSGVFQLSLGSLGTYHVPGYLVWVGVLYAVIGTLLTIRLGRPLVALNFEQQRREATFRYAAVDLRTHAENVALYRGEDQQQNIMQRLFHKVLDNWYDIIMRQKKLMWFTSGYNQLSVMLPLLVALPNYFDKVFLLGGLIQSLSAFGKVQDSLSFLINSYSSIAQWQAIAQRLTTFLNHMGEAEERAEGKSKLIFRKEETDSIHVKNVCIATPRGEILLEGINETFLHGHHYLIQGASGLGKSTFIRALSGIWPYSAGEVSFPKDKLVMYVPQRPYMPIGTLMEAILFPDKINVEMEAQVEQLLHKLKLEHLIPRLRETAAWSEQLSPGEQQRIAFSRVLLHKPDWVFLDESTSMLDITNEERVYQLVQSELPNCSMVSVGHRTSLERHHGHVINMAKYAPQGMAKKELID